MAAYIPDAGDIVWVNFNPQAGHEQDGRRPAIVLSPARYHTRSGLMLCCPTTTRIKGYPFEVALGGQPPRVALADQVRSIDWQARQTERKGRASDAAIIEIRHKVKALIG